MHEEMIKQIMPLENNAFQGSTDQNHLTPGKIPILLATTYASPSNQGEAKPSHAGCWEGNHQDTRVHAFQETLMTSDEKIKDAISIFFDPQRTENKNIIRKTQWTLVIYELRQIEPKK